MLSKMASILIADFQNKWFSFNHRTPGKSVKLSVCVVIGVCLTSLPETTKNKKKNQAIRSLSVLLWSSMWFIPDLYLHLHQFSYCGYLKCIHSLWLSNGHFDAVKVKKIIAVFSKTLYLFFI